MKKSYQFFLTAFILTIPLLFSAQTGPFKKLGKDLPYPAIDACFSKTNQLHAICASKDSLFTYAFDSTSNKWSLKAGLKFANNFYLNLAHQSAKCFFLDTNFFMTVSGIKDTTRIYKRINKGFNIAGKLHNTNPGFPGPDFFVRGIDIRNNVAFITGKFAKVLNGPNLTGIVKFDGINLTYVNIDLSYYYDKAKITFLRNDTLFVAQSDGIYAYSITTSSFSNYFPTSQNILSITGSKNSLFFVNDKNKVYEVRKNKIIDSIKAIDFYNNTFNNYHDLGFIKGKLINLSHLPFGRQELFVRNGSTFKGLITPDHERDYNPDNIPFLKIISDKYNQQYLISGAERIYKNIRFNIVKFNLDSLPAFGFDSIYLQTFGDNNLNGKFNVGDSIPGLGIYTINDAFPFAQFQGKEFLKVILPDYRNYSFRSYFDFFNPSCYQMPIKGNYTSNNLIPGKTKDTLLFPLILKSSTSDKKVYLLGSGRARLNDTVTINVYSIDNGCEQGNSTAYAKVILQAKTVFISSKPAYNSRIGDTLFYKTDSINSFKARAIAIKVKYTNTDFQAEDTVMHKILLCKNLKGNKPLYDIDSLNSRLVYSYDPNEKIAQPGGPIISDIDKVRYTIHFQNKGNDDARDITIIDTFDSRFTTNTINVIDGSHPYTFNMKNNIVTWNFKNINLVTKSTSDLKSRGYIVFEVNKNKALKIGDSVRNKAAIFFDLNKPIITNYATVRMVKIKRDTTVTGIFQTEKLLRSVSVFPNPAQYEITISNYSDKGLRIDLIDLIGKKILEFSVESMHSHSLNIASLSKGIYFFKIQETGETYKLILH